MATLRLNVDPRGAQVGAQKAETALEGVSREAMKTEAATKRVGGGFVTMGNRAEGASRRLAGATTHSRNLGFAVQNASYQVGDFAVQVAAGTSATRALSMQLPQLLGGFGVFGAMAGAVAAIAGALIGVDHQAKEFGDTLDVVIAAIDSFNKATDKSRDAIYGLGSAFKLTGPDTAQALRDLAAISKLEAYKAIDQMNQSLVEMMSGDSIFAGGATRVEKVRDLLGGLKSILREDRFVAQRFIDTLDQMKDASGLENQLAAAKSLRDQFVIANGGIKNLNDTQIEFFKSLSNSIVQMEILGGETNETAISASRLEDRIKASYHLYANTRIQAEKLADATKSAADQAARMAAATRKDPIIFDPRDTRYDRTRALMAQIQDETTHIGSLSQNKASDSLRVVKSAIEEYNALRSSVDDVFAATVKMEDAQQVLNNALQQGIITQTEYNETLALVRASLSATAGQAKEWQSAFEHVGSSFEDNITAMVEGTKTVKEAFRAMAYDVVRELYRILVVQQLVGSFDVATGEGSGLAGLLGGAVFDGGGYTGSGPRAGGIDGKGGFMAMLHPQETVVDHTKGQGMGGVIINQTINVTTGVQQTVRAEVMQLLPKITEASKAGVLDARKRGGAFAGAF